MLKNLQIYRIPKNWTVGPDALADLLRAQEFTECGKSDVESIGWVAPRENSGLVYTVGKNMLISLRKDKKLMPASVINALAKERAKAIEEAQGFAPGKKAMKEIKERVFEELLPRAFIVPSQTTVWIDPVNGWLVVDAAATGKADEVISKILRCVEGIELTGLTTVHSASTSMTNWLKNEEAPYNFTIDQDTELCAVNESKSAVRYVHHQLENSNVREHLKAGKQCTRLALTWNSKISFTLDQKMIVKKIAILDVLKQDNSADAKDAQERFDGEVTMLAAELNLLMTDLVAALGGFAGNIS